MTDQNGTSSSRSPDADIVEAAAEIALQLYARNGDVRPSAFIKTDEGILIVPCESLANQDEKQQFINIVRFMSIEHKSQSVAIAFESWMVASEDAADNALLDEIHARGGSFSEHPKAFEAITVIAESDLGSTIRAYKIVKDGMTVSLEPGQDDFNSDMNKPRGLFSNFHVPTGLRDTPAMKAFADVIGSMIAVRREPIRPSEPPMKN